MIDLAQGIVEVMVRLDADDRSEDFLAVNLHVVLRSGKHSGLQDRPVTGSAAKKASTSAHGFLHPLSGADRVAFANEGTDVGGLVERIACFQFLHTGKQ